MTAIAAMTMADYDEAIALWRACAGIGLNECDDRAMVVAYLDRNPGLSFVVRDAEALVGAVLCGTDWRRGYLHHLAVAARHCGHGLGRALTARCLAGLAAVGIVKCHIFVFADNAAGQEFWSHAGWTRRDDLLVMSSSTLPASRS